MKILVNNSRTKFHLIWNCNFLFPSPLFLSLSLNYYWWITDDSPVWSSIPRYRHEKTLTANVNSTCSPLDQTNDRTFICHYWLSIAFDGSTKQYLIVELLKKTKTLFVTSGMLDGLQNQPIVIAGHLEIRDVAPKQSFSFNLRFNSIFLIFYQALDPHHFSYSLSDRISSSDINSVQFVFVHWAR